VKLAVIDGREVEPCIGSGYCCKKARCWIGTRLHGPGDNCPSLVFKEERYWCGEVMKAEGTAEKAIMDDLFVGAGCCSSLNGDRREMMLKLSSSSPLFEP
jgi:hypothetical protein